MTKNTEYSEGLKKIFQTAGLEKPSADFTINIMERIAKENIVHSPVKNFIPKKIYFLSLIPLLVLIYFTPSVYDWISKFKIDLNAIDVSILKDWIQSFTANLQSSSSPVITSIVLASCILLGLYTMVNYRQSEKPEVY